ncbi:TetR family transcriptional regulator [Actinoplanes philippinensis]|uniref:DNA-binding transcriptional regulator, AcrR family n=1 Tax=Actinoplanes philippinensis TaxID=35752 RepID=A0A1I1ZTA7_9ACTN|nr:TetR/AcrR family transcriptional regulator [Actinoplanes philippinensis]GIE75305.1 TetR family transcriptional regulator [Actinoplanes philippinensis]SFE34822.1 DNA-binding transcriptional regulator, AcrR family [Actinoplanes philippinensis]
MTSPTSGRARQAARNDVTILAAAKEVFLADKRAPVAAVAERAGVGISALYRRYAGKEDLLRKLCHDGLLTFIEQAERASAERDDWAAFETFVLGVVEADVHSLTVHLAGTFTPTEEMSADAVRADELATALFERARPRMRAEVVPADLTMLLEMCAAVRVPDPARTTSLRRRYLAMLLDGLRAGVSLPGPAPTRAELSWRWMPRPDDPGDGSGG